MSAGHQPAGLRTERLSRSLLETAVAARLPASLSGGLKGSNTLAQANGLGLLRRGTRLPANGNLLVSDYFRICQSSFREG